MFLKYQINPSTIVEIPAFLVMRDHRALDPSCFMDIEEKKVLYVIRLEDIFTILNFK